MKRAGFWATSRHYLGLMKRPEAPFALWHRPGYQALARSIFRLRPTRRAFSKAATYGTEAPFDASDPIQLVFRGEPGLLDDLIQTVPAAAR